MFGTIKLSPELGLKGAAQRGWIQLQESTPGGCSGGRNHQVVYFPGLREKFGDLGFFSKIHAVGLHFAGYACFGCLQFFLGSAGYHNGSACLG